MWILSNTPLQKSMCPPNWIKHHTTSSYNFTLPRCILKCKISVNRLSLSDSQLYFTRTRLLKALVGSIQKVTIKLWLTLRIIQAPTPFTCCNKFPQCSKQETHFFLYRHFGGVSWSISGLHRKKKKKNTKRRQEWQEDIHITAVQTPKPHNLDGFSSLSVIFVMCWLSCSILGSASPKSEPRAAACRGTAGTAEEEGIGSTADS